MVDLQGFECDKCGGMLEGDDHPNLFCPKCDKSEFKRIFEELLNELTPAQINNLTYLLKVNAVLRVTDEMDL